MSWDERVDARQHSWPDSRPLLCRRQKVHRQRPRGLYAAASKRALRAGSVASLASTYSLVRDLARVRPLGRFSPKGKSDEVEAFVIEAGSRWRAAPFARARALMYSFRTSSADSADGACRPADPYRRIALFSAHSRTISSMPATAVSR